MHLYYKLKVIIKEGVISYLILLLTTIVKINIITTCFFFIRNMNLYYNEGSTKSTPTHYKKVSDEIVSNFTA